MPSDVLTAAVRVSTDLKLSYLVASDFLLLVLLSTHSPLLIIDNPLPFVSSFLVFLLFIETGLAMLPRQVFNSWAQAIFWPQPPE